MFRYFVQSEETFKVNGNKQTNTHTCKRRVANIYAYVIYYYHFKLFSRSKENIIFASSVLYIYTFQSVLQTLKISLPLKQSENKI